MHYWDTSTLVKLYVAEADSPRFAAHLAHSGPVVTSELARWETFRVLARKETEHDLAPGAAEAIFARWEADVQSGRINLLPMNAAVEHRFRSLTLQLHRSTPPVFARTLDGVHLATADLHGVKNFVATDLNLRKCAAAIGLSLFP